MFSSPRQAKSFFLVAHHEHAVKGGVVMLGKLKNARALCTCMSPALSVLCLSSLLSLLLKYSSLLP
jgi:hypothetical protein